MIEIESKMKLPIGIYKLHIDAKTREHSLLFVSERFKTPSKMYGEVNRNIDLFWNTFVKRVGSMGVLLSGSPGTGKTVFAEVLSNRALEHSMSVIMVVDLNPTVETINYIGMMENVVIMFDEFVKNFNPRLQEKMLTMLSSATNGKKLFIMTENGTERISPYILNRPGRVRYHLDYERISKEVLDEYCAEHNVSPTLYSEIIEKHKTAAKFSFDHLQTIVSEHELYPEDNLDVMLERLNLKVLTKEEPMGIIEIKDSKGEDVIVDRYDDILKSRMMNKNFTYVINIESNRPVFLTKNNFESIDENNVYTFKTDDYTIKLKVGYPKEFILSMSDKLREERKKKDEDNNSQPNPINLPPQFFK